MGYISKKVAAYGQFVLVYIRPDLSLSALKLRNSKAHFPSNTSKQIYTCTCIRW